ncbi:MFS transporter [Gammaproteobacteria bacterium]|nr:MFS transporter [Gammaproteobacteria bacterium]MDB9815621.1 MFS transporter [Gammaproteobacteria bacterium]MDB9860311.1 MFS transporter [Gammaproteobacteria bacterium]MDB9939638.1 MFS transporter [Gammaproteobacteria bacterium]
MNLFQRLSYTALNFPTSAAGMPIFIFILPYYAGDLGLGLSLVGILFFLGRLTDIVTDPIMGVLIDRFPSRWGKHKHWIFISAPIFMVATYLIFLPPTSNPSSLYFFVSLFLVYLSFTLSSITQLSWSTFLAPDYDDRTRLLTLREFMALLGMFCVIAIPAIVELYDTSLSAKVSAIGVFVLIVIPLITINGLYQVPDTKLKKVQSKIENPFKTFKSFFGNSMLNKIVLAAALIAFCMSLNGALYLIWMDVVMELPEYSSRLMLMYYLVSVFGLGIWRYLSIKTSKHFAAGISCLYAIVILLIGFIGFFFIRDMDPSLKLIAVGSFIVLYGFSFSGPMPLINAIIADISDKLSLEQGENISGTVFSYLTTITKVGFALAAVVPYLVLELFWGFDITLGTDNTESSKMAIFYIYTFVPIVSYCIAAYMLFSHSLGRDEHEKIKSVMGEDS